jgi:hypothetical protein
MKKKEELLKKVFSSNLDIWIALTDITNEEKYELLKKVIESLNNHWLVK